MAPFDVYSGYLTVPGPFEQTNYTSLKIHYQFHARPLSLSLSLSLPLSPSLPPSPPLSLTPTRAHSQHEPKTDPIASWHQGGPGSDSIAVGLYTEMGYFQVDSNGTYVNEYLLCTTFIRNTCGVYTCCVYKCKYTYKFCIQISHTHI